VADLPRRKFLKTIGTVAVVSALPEVLLAAQKPARTVAVFWETDFPASDGCNVTRELLEQSLTNFSISFLGERDLMARLNTEHFDLLITPYGSAFPKRAWRALLQYLRAGGNWLNLGGVPLSRPVVSANGKWRVEDPQTQYHKQLGITHSFAVKASIEKYDNTEIDNSLKAEEIYELYVRLSSSSNEPDEAGSDGPHEGVVYPLVRGMNREGRPVAAPVIQIDRLLADFAGGRWVFANFRGTLDAKALTVLAQRATQGASRFEVRSEFACYRPGEIPSLSVRLIRPKGDLPKLVRRECDVEVRDQADRVVTRLDLTFSTENTLAVASAKLPDNAKLAPGLYKVHARTKLSSVTNSSSIELSHTSGFWIYDEALLARGKPLTVDKHFFYRDGQVFPVTGTTYMASDVHRRFLFDPNPFVWDNDFREMKAAGVNMVRTGIWTGWKKYMPEIFQLNEVTLRAFDAFLLTAHKYDIPIIFTFFAFLPETWGGENAYLDPRSVRAQQRFIQSFTKRCRQVKDVIWDFINEPSFCSPKHLWSCRPNYDAYEKAAWKEWLRNRYPAASDEERVSRLQQLWRTSKDDSLDLPKLEDFDSVHLIDERLPLKTLDYRLFAQDMFIDWVRRMSLAVVSQVEPLPQLMTVGQDEAGLGDSPNIQFFAPHIDVTSLHNWWANDDLLWDSVLGKTPGKLSLIEETGVMFYEKADGGGAWRSEEEASRLLERKMALSFAADGAGFVEWIWNTNPYMNSTNEVGIGFHRVDRTAKPELEPFLAIAKFMGQYGHHLRDRVSEPVAMVIPHSQMFAPRSFAYDGTRRCVRAMYYHCGVPMQAVSEYTLAEYSRQAKLILVPAPRVLTQSCWETLLEEAGNGATVAISGAIDSDEHFVPVARTRLFGQPAQTVPVAQSEAITIDGQEFLMRFDGEKMQRVEKGVVGSQLPVKPLIHSVGSGRIVWSPLPLELSDSLPALVAFYKLALEKAGVEPIFTASPATPAVLILPAVFRDVVLYTFVSEIDRDTQMTISDLESRTSFDVLVRAGRTAMVLLQRKTGTVLGRL